MQGVTEYLFSGFAASILFLLISTIRLRIKNEKSNWFWRLMILISGLYLSAVFSLTVSPDFVLHGGGNINLMPFEALSTAFSNPLNFFGNIILFMPLGVLLVLLSNKCQKLHITLLAGAGLSLMIELLQLFGARSTDIDDIILNTIGTLCGFIIAKIILYRLPHLRKKVGILKQVDGKYYRKRHDAGGIVVLVVFVLVAVYITGYTEKSDHLQSAEVSNQDIEVSEQSPKMQTEEISEAISATNAYLWNISSNTILYDKESNQQIAPASTAKMLTALTVLDYCDEDDKVTVGQEVQQIAEDASRAWLYPGNELTIRQLLDALLLPSGNDAAYALAVYTGRKICSDDDLSIDEAIRAFVKAMNEKAADCGADDSNFINPDGYDADGQYTTAYDLARIARKFLKSKTLCAIAGSYCISDDWLSGQQITYNNTNELINPEGQYYYQCAIGLKTGNSEKAGSCLVSSAYIDNDLYVCVVMGSTEEGRWTDSLTLYNAIEQ